MNFYGAVNGGDGLHVFSCQKFMLPYLRQDGAASIKYTLEALYLLFQAYALLSPQDAHCLIWNRFYILKQGSSGNIPLDLALEHYNNVIKTLMHKMGPNATNRSALNPLIKALTINKKVLDNFDVMCSVIQRFKLVVKFISQSFNAFSSSCLHKLISIGIRAAIV